MSRNKDISDYIDKLDSRQLNIFKTASKIIPNYQVISAGGIPYALINRMAIFNYTPSGFPSIIKPIKSLSDIVCPLLFFAQDHSMADFQQTCADSIDNQVGDFPFTRSDYTILGLFLSKNYLNSYSNWGTKHKKRDPLAWTPFSFF